ncbi:MAG: hypothetical protein DMG96_35570 [Acidobacteria bacterium]|nr:MAG: hypothetical protein DMG96_35570 [Acidobacteriota bacterium]
MPPLEGEWFTERSVLVANCMLVSVAFEVQGSCLPGDEALQPTPPSFPSPARCNGNRFIPTRTQDMNRKLAGGIGHKWSAVIDRLATQLAMLH